MPIASEPQLNMSRKIVRSLGILMGTVVVGAIGSGVWETMLSPALSGVSTYFLTLLSRMFAAYSDALHARIAVDTTDPYSEESYIIVSAFMVSLPLVAFGLMFGVSRVTSKLSSTLDMGKEEEGQEDSPDKEELRKIIFPPPLRLFMKYRRSLMSTYGLLCFVMFCSFFYTSIRAKYTRRAAVFIERSVAILRPQLDDKDVVRINAEYRGIGSAKDFFELQDQLVELSHKHNVKIPDFKAVGRK
jgi:hypothetical protein